MSKQIYVVGAAILNENHQILASKRADDRILGTLWEFPGGKIEPGETPEQALTRELREEFNDQITVGPAVGPTSVYEYDFGTVHLTVFYARLESHHFDLVAHSELRWCNQAELGELTWAGADAPIAKLVSQANLKEISFWVLINTRISTMGS